MGQAGSKQEMFWEACGFGRAHLVQKFIEHGIDVNWVSSIHGCSPIHVASQGKADVVQLLIDAGCDLSVVDSRGNTAVHHAAMQGHADIIQMLVDAGADINAQDKNGWTPLHCAAYYAHLRAVEVLVRNHCNISILNKDGRSALIETARSKNYEEEKILGEIARYLIKAGCEVDLKCTDLGEANFTGLMFAAYHNHLEVASAFIEGGCDLNSATCYTKWTALHWASDCDNAEMVYLLLDAGADPTKTGMRGELASDRSKDVETKEILDKAVLTFREGDRGETTSLSSAHSMNAQASLDTARALESLSTHAKNRDILSVPLPTMPALGIASRSDPKTRYTRRTVTEVAVKNVNANFPWKSYSKQGSPSPDKDGQGGDEEKRKMFPSQDDKTNAFMDSLAQRINYMTSKIAIMGQTDPKPQSNGTLEDTTLKSSNGCDSPGDSGLSTRVSSELTTPDDGVQGSLSLNLKQGSANDDDKKSLSPRSPRSTSGTSSKLSSPSKHDMLDAEADHDIIEESHRGFAILRALQERHRRSMYLEETTVETKVTPESADKPEILSTV
ncbi:ankyrin repeat domain-containing protein 50 [Biomphalaria glabrata]|nr:ankyrin repeat domain-containing protein 50 [Biomphalaria glabrata]